MSGRTLAEEDLLAAFRMFDKDGSGFISVSELCQAMTELGESLTNQEAEALTRMADINGDGKVAYKEFVKILSAK